MSADEIPVLGPDREILGRVDAVRDVDDGIEIDLTLNARGSALLGDRPGSYSVGTATRLARVIEATAKLPSPEEVAAEIRAILHPELALADRVHAYAERLRAEVNRHCGPPGTSVICAICESTLAIADELDAEETP